MSRTKSPPIPIDSAKEPPFLRTKTVKDDYFQLPPKPDSQPRARSNESTWENTLERCIKGIVSIKAARVRCLDTEVPGTYSATGFVVDAERGIILTNRHVVSVSPIRAQAVLCNYEEIKLKPIYRDPVHDFGFLQYEPCSVRFLDIPAIELYPQGARVGQEIRVVGNDAGEKLSILSGTLARLDREAPNYGIGEYNDFNTFYYQAASSTSSGSSGSPVLDLQGRAIALNAGGASTSASSYYLPLDRVQRALRLLQRERPVPRGTLQVEFQYNPYDELARLGLGRHIELRLRSHYAQLDSQHHGLLVVKSVLPNGPGDGHLESGDILLVGNGAIIAHFLDLERLLDDAIGKTVRLVVSRAGELHECEVQVQDLEAITPHRLVEFGGGILNDFSYQMARSYGLSLHEPGAYVAFAGYMLGGANALRKSVIVGLDNQRVRNIDDFVAVASRIPQGSRVQIRYYSLRRPLKERVMILHMDRRWHAFRIATRNDNTGLWDFEDVKECPPVEISTAVPKYRHTASHVVADSVDALKESLVAVDCFLPYITDGLQDPHNFGAGLVVSLDPPLLVCDRDAVPVAMGSITLTFANTITIPGHLLFLHPWYNFAILSFDPALLSGSNIEIRVAALSRKALSIGDHITYVGLGGDSMPMTNTTTVSAVRAVRTQEAFPPRWRAINVEAARASDGSLGGQGGALADANGVVYALWMSFATVNDQKNSVKIMAGLSTALILPVLEKIRTGKVPSVRGLDIELWSMSVANARLLGLSQEWLERLTASHALYVLGITDQSSPCASLLQHGDIVLKINSDMITRVSELARYDQEKELTMTIFRDGKVRDIQVPTTYFDGQETTRVIGWQGAVVQEGYQAAREQVQKAVPKGVYIACCMFGSPAEASLRPEAWIIEINGVPTPTLDKFLDAISRQPSAGGQERQSPVRLMAAKKLEHNAAWLLKPPTDDSSVELKEQTHVRVKYASPSNTIDVSMLELDNHYWPTWQIQKDTTVASGWKYT